MSKVVILGAGSSKGCGFPLGDEMLESILDLVDKDCRKFLDHLFPGIIENEAIDPYITFDRVFSVIDFYIKNNINFAGYSIRSLQGIQNKLFQQYIRVLSDFSLASLFDLDERLLNRFKRVKENYDSWYKPFFEKLIQEHGEQISFISFNYDVLIDKVLNELKKDGIVRDYHYGVDLYDVDDQGAKINESGIALLKPHGSLNIVECPICKRLYTSSKSLQRVYFKGEECRHCAEPLKALYKAPKLNKEIDDYALNDIRSKVVDVLSKADSIDVIGYALPNYDMNVLALLLEGRQRNPNWDSLEISIIDCNPSLVSKYENVFATSIKPHCCWLDGFEDYAKAVIKNSI